MENTKQQDLRLMEPKEILKLAKKGKLGLKQLYHDKVLTKKQYDMNLEWIKALRSGKYKQDVERLGNCEIGMCCLGLANHIFEFNLPDWYGDLGVECFDQKLENLKRNEEEENALRHYFELKFFTDQQNDNLDNYAYRVLGLYNKEGKSYEESCYSLVIYNDTEGYNFSQIADLLEASLTLVEVKD